VCAPQRDEALATRVHRLAWQRGGQRGGKLTHLALGKPRVHTAHHGIAQLGTLLICEVVVGQLLARTPRPPPPLAPSVYERHRGGTHPHVNTFGLGVSEKGGLGRMGRRPPARHRVVGAAG
jgi:hypothetical protein